MDRLGIGAKLMSGIMLAATGRVVPPPSPLSISATVIGSGSSNVTTGSGNTQVLTGGYRIFSATAFGGSPPYHYIWERQNALNKTSLADTEYSQVSVNWSGMIVGEYQSTTARCHVTDSSGATASSSTQVIGLTRIS